MVLRFLDDFGGLSHLFLRAILFFGCKMFVKGGQDWVLFHLLHLSPASFGLRNSLKFLADLHLDVPFHRHAIEFFIFLHPCMLATVSFLAYSLSCALCHTFPSVY